MNRREMLIGTAASAAVIPIVGIEAAKASITKVAFFSDELMKDCAALGYIPEFFTAKWVQGAVAPLAKGSSWYDITWQKDQLIYCDPVNFEPWERSMRGNMLSRTHFTIERVRYGSTRYISFGRQIMMKVYDDGKYVASIVKLEKTFNNQTSIITAMPTDSPPNLITDGWKKVVW